MITSKLKSVRLAAVMTQQELASRAGVAKGTIVAAENGKEVRISTVRKLAVTLGVSPQALLASAEVRQET